jgi:hypothetical protein
MAGLVYGVREDCARERATGGGEEKGENRKWKLENGKNEELTQRTRRKGPAAFGRKTHP